MGLDLVCIFDWLLIYVWMHTVSSSTALQQTQVRCQDGLPHEERSVINTCTCLSCSSCVIWLGDSTRKFLRK